MDSVQTGQIGLGEKKISRLKSETINSKKNIRKIKDAIINYLKY